MNALTDKRGALYPSTQSQKRTAASIPTLAVLSLWNKNNYSKPTATLLSLPIPLLALAADLCPKTFQELCWG